MRRGIEMKRIIAEITFYLLPLCLFALCFISDARIKVALVYDTFCLYFICFGKELNDALFNELEINKPERFEAFVKYLKEKQNEINKENKR